MIMLLILLYHVKLKDTENYQVLSCAMLLALEGKNKTIFIDGTCKRYNIDEVLGKQWDRVNAIILGWILNSSSEELFLGLDDCYMQIKSNILSRDVLPDVRNAYAIIFSEESHRVVSSFGSEPPIMGIADLLVVLTKYLANISKRRAFWSLNEDILKITILTTNTPYPSRKIRRIRACTHQRPQRKQV
ncbi:ribonuclease H-like domain-containing protein [Tanacetum coccineum]